MKMRVPKIACVAIELLGIAITGAGIGLELSEGGEFYLVLITIGSCVIAGGGIIFAKFMKKD